MSLNLQAFPGWPGEPDWMKKLRSRARADFADLPWPGRRDEEWQRTNISSIELEERKVSPPVVESPATGEAVLDFSGALTVEGGRVVSIWLDPELEAKGVRLTSLRSAVVEGKATSRPEALDASLSEVLRGADSKLQPLHALLLESGVLLIIPGNLVVEKPFLIEFLENRQDVLATPQIIVHAGRASQATFVVRRRSPDGLSFTVNSAAYVSMDDGAVLKWIDVQEYGDKAIWVDHSVARLGRDAQLFHWSACLGCDVVKTRLTLNLEGEGASLRTHGLYFAVGDQHKDIRVVQNHIAPRTSSYALYKGAVRDRSRTIFQGMIEVKPSAAQTDAYLSNKNLVLTDGARADSLPQLKIDTNDVKCSHGSTTGKVNEEEVFYLTSRGLSRAEARLLIAEGLFAELIAEAPDFLQAEIEARVVEALGAP